MEQQMNTTALIMFMFIMKLVRDMLLQMQAGPNLQPGPSLQEEL